MKKCSILILLAILPALMIAQTLPYPYQLKEEAAHYKKKKVKTMNTFTVFGPEDEMLTQTRHFDKNGYLMDTRVWDDYDEEFRLQRHTYNENGLLIMNSDEAEDGYIYNLTEYNYDNDKLISEQHSSVEDGSYMVYYIYDEDGRIDSSYIADAEPRKNAWFYSDGQLDSIVGFTVFNYENPDEWNWADVESFEYGKKGVLMKESFCSIFAGCYIHEYTYRKKLKVLDVVSGSDAVIYRTSFQYNKKLLVKQENKVSEEMEGFQEDETLRFEYEFY